ncbi:MAG: MBL fold metallo-hydrolase, partial [Erysipelotrichaceae bacterium]|nr:MBL fold metallo-hydrolase [Erysipelotrichaceae bacterium]
MQVSKDILYIGVNDHDIDLFEGQYRVPYGMSYNSYVILDEKIAVLDSVEARFTHEWLDNLQNALGERKPDYLIVQHMEPDHSANIMNFMKLYPEAVIVSSDKAFKMIFNYFGTDFEDRRILIKEGDTLSLGSHELSFVAAPMVHWPEVMMTYDRKDKVLFSADAFGKFGALDHEDDWINEARRYYIGIVGKYGVQVQNVLKKAKTLEIETIAPLHGPVLKEDLKKYLSLYDIWSAYGIEKDGVMIAYTSVYGHTKDVISLLEKKLKEHGAPSVKVYDLARCDMSEAVADAFAYGKIILATTTYNADIYPFMRDFLYRLSEHNFQRRTVAFVENGSWAPLAIKTMKEILSKCKDLTYCDKSVHILSALNDSVREELDALSEEICIEYKAREKKEEKSLDPTALFNIGYGLYVVTSNDGKKDNGLIVNTVSQIADNPQRVMVCINKQNYSYHVIKE